MGIYQLSVEKSSIGEFIHFYEPKYGEEKAAEAIEFFSEKNVLSCGMA
jgi:hypothetical protein